MNLDLLAIIALVLAAIPCGLFLLNLCVYRPLLGGRRRDETHLTIHQERSGPTRDGCYRISVLIPARNEETNIRATLEAALANCAADFEVVVLDDHSTDCTAAIVSEFAARECWSLRYGQE